MIKLHQPPAPQGWPDTPNLSPFCTKLETYLRMVGLPYELGPGNPRLAPKGKIPFIVDGGTKLGDSALIIDHLKKKYGDPLDAKLDAQAVAQGHMLRRMVEEGTYFLVGQLRWAREQSYPYVAEQIGKLFPPALRPILMPLIRKSALKSFRAQGAGRHTEAEILAMVDADMTAAAHFLGDKPYFHGDEPTSLDATMYGFLVAGLWVPWDGPEKKLIAKHANLVAYCERMRDRYWR